MMDIDFFKDINDNYGHDIGDKALKLVASILKQRARKSDLVGRIGGEEFLIVLPTTTLSEAEVVAESIREQLAQTKFSQHQIAMTCSFGCIERQENESYESSLKRSDLALYKAKRNGRNQTYAQ